MGMKPERLLATRLMYFDLIEVADKKAYAPDVLNYLQSATLNVKVPVRALTEEMRTPLIAESVHSDFYDNNGWRY